MPSEGADDVMQVPAQDLFEQQSEHWSFLTNHAVVLLYMVNHPDDTMYTVASNLNMRERLVAQIIADLRHHGYLEATRNGRRNHYSVNLEMPLRRRHPFGSTTVRQLASAFSQDPLLQTA
jgi:hypothetical protein